jgi:hypothetical protein
MIKQNKEVTPHTHEWIEYKEFMYECTNYQYSESKAETTFDIIHDVDNITTFTLDKPSTYIYIKNNNGVIIDSYKWDDKGNLS